MDAWPSAVYGFPVTKVPIGTFGLVEDPVSFCTHDAENDSAKSVLDFFRGEPGIVSHFIIGDDVIYQLVSLDHHAGAVRGDLTIDPHLIQAEVTGFAKTKPWTIPPARADRFAAVLAYSADYHGIPLVIPNPAWKDDGSDIDGIWATEEQSRRDWAAVHFPMVQGVYRHLDLPWNVHWDPGALNLTDLVDQAADLLKGEDDMDDPDRTKGFQIGFDTVIGAADPKAAAGPYLGKIDGDGKAGKNDGLRSDRIGRREGAIAALTLKTLTGATP